MLAGLDAFWRAFSDLSTCRGVGMTAGPIAWRDAVLWAQMHHVEDFDEFWYHIRTMDAVYCEQPAKGRDK